MQTRIPIPTVAHALIFDLDGTLADSMPVHIAAWQQAGRKFGVEVTKEMIYRTSGMPTTGVVEIFNREMGWDLVPAEVKAAKDVAYEMCKKEIRIVPIPVVLEVVEAFKDKMPMAIGTGSTRPRTEDTMGALGIKDWFEVIVTADDVVNHKPAPDTYVQCAQGLQVAPENCLVFEDAEFGLLAAKAAGMMSIDVRPYL